MDYKNNTLPDLPSELLTLALTDLRKVEGMPHKFKVDMINWYNPLSGKQCLICLAGSVMAMTLEINSALHVMPSEFDTKTASKLQALNYLRMGEIENAFKVLNIPLPKSLSPKVVVEEYGPKFHASMLSLVKILQTAGY